MTVIEFIERLQEMDSDAPVTRFSPTEDVVPLCFPAWDSFNRRVVIYTEDDCSEFDKMQGFIVRKLDEMGSRP